MTKAPTGAPKWIHTEALKHLHNEGLAIFGGPSGVRDENLLESALARPKNLHAYEGDASIERLAASYGYGLAKNHPFVDGNKRVAFLAIGLFLRLNGKKLVASQVDAIRTILALAAGDLSEDQLADWIAANVDDV